MANNDVQYQYSEALHAVGRLEGDAIERARAATPTETAGIHERELGQKATEQPAVVSVPALGPGMGEHAAMTAMLEGLQVLDAERWRVTLPLTGGGR